MEVDTGDALDIKQAEKTTGLDDKPAEKTTGLDDKKVEKTTGSDDKQAEMSPGSDETSDKKAKKDNEMIRLCVEMQPPKLRARVLREFEQAQTATALEKARAILEKAKAATEAALDRTTAPSTTSKHASKSIIMEMRSPPFSVLANPARRLSTSSRPSS